MKWRQQILGRVTDGFAKQIRKFLVGHRKTGAVVEIRLIESKRSIVLEIDQVIENPIDIVGLTIGGESHELVLAGIHLEAGVISEGRIEQSERVRKMQLF